MNLTECWTAINDATRELENLKEMRSLVSQLTRAEKNMSRVGLFNIVQKISSSLFGVLDSENEVFLIIRFTS